MIVAGFSRTYAQGQLRGIRTVADLVNVLRIQTFVYGVGVLRAVNPHRTNGLEPGTRESGRTWNGLK